MKISYEVVVGNARMAMVSITPCPYGLLTEKYDIPVHVGGMACTRCKHFVMKNVEKKEVTCGHE